eukprot:snap_masked-scaffold_3-processed-gene-6.36-mRNA-1 protein AED:1.00 eAED:1.00 QI:0/0/0/0/1/1/3/0/76
MEGFEALVESKRQGGNAAGLNTCLIWYLQIFCKRRNRRKFTEKRKKLRSFRQLVAHGHLYAEKCENEKFTEGLSLI